MVKLPHPLKINFRTENGRVYGWVEKLSFAASGATEGEVGDKINNAIRSLIKRNYIVNKGQDWYFSV